MHTVSVLTKLFLLSIIEITVLYALNFYGFYFLFLHKLMALKKQPFPIIFPLDQAQTHSFKIVFA